MQGLFGDADQVSPSKCSPALTITARHHSERVRDWRVDTQFAALDGVAIEEHRLHVNSSTQERIRVHGINSGLEILEQKLSIRSYLDILELAIVVFLNSNVALFV